MLLALATVDAAVGMHPLVHGHRRHQLAAEYIGAILLLCAVVLAAVPVLAPDTDSATTAPMPPGAART